jgi:hypothetical protein
MQVSNNVAVETFKKVYGSVRDLQPEDQILAKKLPFESKAKVGDSYIEAMILTAETGWTLGGAGYDAFEINPAVAGVVKQTKVVPYVSVLPSVVPWAVMSRSAGAGEKAFFDATKHIVKNNLKSHGKLLEIMRIHGQSAKLLGRVSYATATYRGVSFTAGTGTLVSDYFGSVAFTNGVSYDSTNNVSYVLLAPGNFAAGIWVAMEGAEVVEVNSSGVEVNSGKLLGVEPDLGFIKVSGQFTAASSTTSHRLCYRGMEGQGELPGIIKILSTSGTLFEVDNTKYSLWQGTRYALANTKLTDSDLQKAVGRAVNRGGLDGDVTVLVNPRSWATLMIDQAAKRSYDHSYSPSGAENGFNSITFYTQTGGKMEVMAHRCIMEGDALVIHEADWSRSGSAEIGFSIPGMDKEVIFPLENQAGYAFRSFADQYIFCHAPARSVYISGINDEA